MKEFPIKDDMNGAELTDRKRPDGDVGKRQTCVVLSAADKVGTCTEKSSVVPHLASKSFATDHEVKTRGGEGASEVDQVGDEAVWGVRSNPLESEWERV